MTGFAPGLLASSFVAGVLFASGIVKLVDPGEFYGALAGYRVLRRAPDWLLRRLARVVPVSELAIGLAILIPETQTLGLGLAVVLLLVFYLALQTDDRANFSCGCAGAVDVESPKGLLVGRTACLMVAAGAAFFWSASASPSGLSAALVAVVVTAPAALIAVDFPLIAHVVAIDRANVPDRVATANAEAKLRSRGVEGNFIKVFGYDRTLASSGGLSGES